MKSFIVNLDREGKKYTCFVQQIACKPEDIFIVNLNDSSLIRQAGRTKILFYKDRDLQENLEEDIWNAIRKIEPPQDGPPETYKFPFFSSPTA